jgi:hypothetical protein
VTLVDAFVRSHSIEPVDTVESLSRVIIKVKGGSEHCVVIVELVLQSSGKRHRAALSEGSRRPTVKVRVQGDRLVMNCKWSKPKRIMSH